MCAKRISKYDLTDNVRHYLIDLICQTNSVVESYQYNGYDDSTAVVTYTRNIHDLTTALCDGLDSLYSMQKHKIKEQTKLRSGTQNYYKKYYRIGRVQKIDCYVDGKYDITFMAHYEGNKRFLIPFRPDAKPSGTYTIVTVRVGENITEEYLVNNSQIAYYRYDKESDSVFRRTYINYAPNGTYPLLGCEIGSFKISDQIEYKMFEQYIWYSEFDAERKNTAFPYPDIPIIKRIDS